MHPSTSHSKHNPSAKHRFAIPATGIDILWPLVILVAFCFYVALVPQPPNDLWWHIKVGEYIYTQHTIPETNIFAWTLPPEQPFFYAAWLGELLLYLLYRAGGIEMTLFVRNLLIVVTFGLLAWEAKRRSMSWRIAAFVLALAAIISMTVPLVRTQMWAWLPFVLFFILLSRYTCQEFHAHWLLLLPLLMVFWVNVHGTFIMGLVLAGSFLLGEGLRALLRLESALPWRKITWLGVIVALVAVCTLANPRTIEIFGYITNLMSDQPVQQLVDEWKSPTPQGLANITFYISVLLLIVALAYSRYKPTPTEMILLVGFLWLAWDGQRSMIWYALIAIPILAQAISQLPFAMPSFTPHRKITNTILAAILFVPYIFVQPWLVEDFPLPESYWEQILRDSPQGPMLAADTPVAAVAYLEQNPGGHIFNEMGFGSYLIWALPEQGVFVDTRIELYPYQQWIDYIQISQGIRYNQLLEQYGADRVLLHTNLQAGLSQALAEDPTWTMEYEDRFAQIWFKK
ncbi:MAG: hypothetical protein JW726_07260 [Anaerolineales bacterium]|nr:hypothetical protein [Anaerolineales bacterium]